MTHTVWRIAADTKDYSADDLTGKGAETTGGRWNEKGTAMLYTATNRALACLETIVHFNAGGLPLNRYLVAIEIDDSLWKAAKSETAATLPVGWDAEPASRTSIDFGTAWAKASSSLLLSVPSVIVPEEVNILINTRHPDAARIKATKVRRWIYDPRIVKL
ncbi:MAG: RES family NAD+ phosphorylase [Alphaproteobacteria bacterium]|jgi:RES domain-containing protein|nr:RES family NAD+ phosphorylase [Alphaproteobacteria bacterium]